MSKAKLPEKIQITAYVADFLSQYAEAILQGYRMLQVPYSPVAMPNGLLMATMQLPSLIPSDAR